MGGDLEGSHHRSDAASLLQAAHLLPKRLIGFNPRPSRAEEKILIYVGHMVRRTVPKLIANKETATQEYTAGLDYRPRVC
jgi:hypothetical protein